MLSFRVRHLLSSMDTTQRANLKKLLSKKLVMPEAATGKYPAALLGIFPKEESYSLLGCVAEEMLRFSPADITLANLHPAILKWYPEYSELDKAKLLKSKTTQPFLDHLIATRQKLDTVVKGKQTMAAQISHNYRTPHLAALRIKATLTVVLFKQMPSSSAQLLLQVGKSSTVPIVIYAELVMDVFLLLVCTQQQTSSAVL
jgi:hypothetical protein